MAKYVRPLAAYRRVSRLGERDESQLRSPELQQQAIARYAEAEGFEVVFFPAELDVSGSKAKRPILDQILAGVKSGEYGGIVVAKLDRLSRLRPAERLMLWETVEDAGGVIRSASEQLDDSTPEGRFARDVFLGVARMQWEKYKEGFDLTKRDAIAKGIAIGPTPFGYKREGRKANGRPAGKLVPDPKTAPLVREAYRLAERSGLDAAVAYLRAQAPKGRNGAKTWSRFTTARLLGSPAYVGTAQYGELVLRGAHEPLVDGHTWRRVNRLPDVQRYVDNIRSGEPMPPAQRQRRYPASFPLTRYAVCASCGHEMVGARAGKGVRTYRCETRRRKNGADCPAPAMVLADRLESYVRDQLIAFARERATESARAEAAFDDALGPEPVGASLEAFDIHDREPSVSLEREALDAALAELARLEAMPDAPWKAAALAAQDDAVAQARDALEAAEAAATPAPDERDIANAPTSELGELVAAHGLVVKVGPAHKGRVPLEDRVRLEESAP